MRLRSVRRFSSVPPSPASKPPVVAKRAFFPRVLFGTAAFVVGATVGAQGYLYLVAPPHRPHGDQFAMLLDTVHPGENRVQPRHEGLQGAVPLEEEEVVVVEVKREEEVVAEVNKEVEEPVIMIEDEPIVVSEQPVVVAEVVEQPVIVAEPVVVVAEPVVVVAEPVTVIVEQEKSSTDPKQVVVVLSARLDEAVALAAQKQTEIENLLHDIRKMDREMEKRIAVIRQDLEAESLSAFESRLHIERMALEDRKQRDLSKEIEHLEAQLAQSTAAIEARIRSEAIRDNDQRMTLLRDLYQEIVAAEEALRLSHLRSASFASAFAASEIAATVHDATRRSAPFGRAQVSSLRDRLSGHADSVVATAVASVPARVWTRGVATDELLVGEFDKAARKGVAASLLPAEKGGGLLALAGRALAGLVRPAEGEIDGDEPDAVFARARVMLLRDELAAAVTELERLPPSIFQTCEEFALLARDRLALDNAVGVIRANARVQIAQ